LLGGLALACVCLSAAAGGTTPDKSKSPSMRFEWRSEGPAEDCGKSCRVWISAAGPVTERTPRDFEAFAGGKDVHGATLVLDSEGGSVVSTIELGHMLRRFDITTTIGKSVTAQGADGRSHTTLSPAAACESMCAFVLLGGARRFVPAEARVLVHQIWLSGKRDRAESGNYTAEELVLVEHDIGILARYTVEMGGGIELLETALRVPPWERLYRLSSDEVQRMGLNTVQGPFEAHAPAVAAAPALGATLAKAPGVTLGRD